METIIVSVLCSLMVAIIAHIGILKQINTAVYSNPQFKWDEDLRSTIFTSLLEIKEALNNNNTSENVSIIYNDSFIKLCLLLDSEKPNEKKLLDKIKLFWKEFESNNEHEVNEFQELCDETIKIYRDIVNDEWKKLKRGYY